MVERERERKGDGGRDGEGEREGGGERERERESEEETETERVAFIYVHVHTHAKDCRYSSISCNTTEQWSVVMAHYPLSCAQHMYMNDQSLRLGKATCTCTLESLLIVELGRGLSKYP